MIYQPNEISPDLIERIKAMPKTEIHVHLEGATDADTVWDLAKRNNVSLPAPTLTIWKEMYEFTDFDHFIEIYLLAANCMQTIDDFVFMVDRFLAQQAAQNIRYCEVFLSATLLVEKFPAEAFAKAMKKAVDDGKKKHGVEAVFIPDIARQVPESKHKVLDFVLAGQDSGVFIGLGLGGSEVGFPPDLFEDVYAEARRQGLRVVAHAGETTGAETIWGSINLLKAERIGHGIRAVDDPKLVDYLRETQLPLEVSPVSNYRLKVAAVDQPHPIQTLMRQGVYVTVNSDDPPMFSTDLNSEYILLAQQGFSWDEIWQANLNTLNATFLSDERQSELRKEWDAFALKLS